VLVLFEVLVEVVLDVPSTAPSEDRVTPAFGGVRRRAALGVRLEGRTS